MAYGVTYITTQGAILAAKTLQSKTLKFSKFMVGSGKTADDNVSTFKALTELVSEVYSFDITRISRSTYTQVNVKGTFKNTDIEQGFCLNELGLFAIDPDTQDEVLFAYVNYGDKAEYINNSISERKEYFYDIVITVDNADNVQIVLNQSSAFITEKELQEESSRLENLINTKAEPPRSKRITLLSSDWVENGETGYFEYVIPDENITKNHLINGYPDLKNQERIVNGYIQSYNGGYKFITGEVPEEDIVMDITIEKTVPEMEEVE